MNFKYILNAFIIVFLSVIFAGIFYVGWLALFLLTIKSANYPAKVLLWLSGPPVTALGFATGAWFSELLTKTRKTAFARILIWPLIGCVIGAGVIFSFGPMLIVFGMFAIGTVSIILREISLPKYLEGH